MGSIIKSEWEEHIRFLLLQFPADIQKVAEEASTYFGTDVPVDQVVRIRRKIKSRQDRDVSLWVASSITQKLLQASRERQAKLEAMYTTWHGAEKGIVSVCCKGPVEKWEPTNQPWVHRCLVCNTDCHVKTAMYPEIEKLKMKIIQEMRKESELMVKFAKDLGFTAHEPQKREFHQTTNFVMVGDQKTSEAIPIDVEGAKKLEEMSPVERERVIKKLEKMSQGQEPPVEAEFVSQPKEDPPGEKA
jgi:hypothetical protein